MNVAIVGTGYVAEMYGNTLAHHPELNLVGAYDKNPSNLAAFCRRWPVRAYASLDEMLGDTSVEMVLNLTSPRSHFEVSARCLDAGKHVYSEKPLGMNSDQASKLVALAEERGLYLASAPCSLLSETAQTVWKAINDGAVGKVRLVYANFDDGMIAPNLAPWTWINDCGVPWPAKDEFEVGCTYIHAGYVLTLACCILWPGKNSDVIFLVPDSRQRNSGRRNGAGFLRRLHRVRRRHRGTRDLRPGCPTGQITHHRW